MTSVPTRNKLLAALFYQEEKKTRWDFAFLSPPINSPPPKKSSTMNFVNHSVDGAKIFHSSWLIRTCRRSWNRHLFFQVNICVATKIYRTSDIAKTLTKNCESFFGGMEILKKLPSLLLLTTWVFPKIGVPQNGWFIMENPIKMDDLEGKRTILGNTHITLKPLFLGGLEGFRPSATGSWSFLQKPLRY